MLATGLEQLPICACVPARSCHLQTALNARAAVLGLVEGSCWIAVMRRLAFVASSAPLKAWCSNGFSTRSARQSFADRWIERWVSAGGRLGVETMARCSEITVEMKQQPRKSLLVMYSQRHNTRGAVIDRLTHCLLILNTWKKEFVDHEPRSW